MLSDKVKEIVKDYVTDYILHSLDKQYYQIHVEVFILYKNTILENEQYILKSNLNDDKIYSVIVNFSKNEFILKVYDLIHVEEIKNES